MRVQSCVSTFEPYRASANLAVRKNEYLHSGSNTLSPYAQGIRTPFPPTLVDNYTKIGIQPCLLDRPPG